MRYISDPNNSGDEFVGLTLQKTASVTLVVKAQDARKKSTTIGTDIISVPQQGTYTLPIPKAALFGKQSFQLTLSDTGDITTVDYGKLSGAAGAGNAAAAVASAYPTATANAANELKSQADIIAQQHRLIGCHTNPTGCK